MAAAVDAASILSEWDEMSTAPMVKVDMVLFMSALARYLLFAYIGEKWSVPPGSCV